MEWLRARPEVDPGRIGVIGSSFGTFFSAILVSDEPRYRTASVIGSCCEPGGYSIFEEASPTFKRRFMFMSGITDEAKFDQLRRTLDWNGYAQRIRIPFMVVGGGPTNSPRCATARRSRPRWRAPRSTTVLIRGSTRRVDDRPARRPAGGLRALLHRERRAGDPNTDCLTLSALAGAKPGPGCHRALGQVTPAVGHA
jgi:hypothetical protein